MFIAVINDGTSLPCGQKEIRILWKTAMKKKRRQWTKIGLCCLVTSLISWQITVDKFNTKKCHNNKYQMNYRTVQTHVYSITISIIMLAAHMQNLIDRHWAKSSIRSYKSVFPSLFPICPGCLRSRLSPFLTSTLVEVTWLPQLFLDEIKLISPFIRSISTCWPLAFWTKFLGLHGSTHKSPLTRFVIISFLVRFDNFTYFV